MNPIIAQIIAAITKGESILDAVAALEAPIKTVADDLIRIAGDIEKAPSLVMGLLTALPELNKLWADIQTLEAGIAGVK